MCETCVLVDTQTHARWAAALSTSWEQKGDGPGQRHSHSAVPKHVPFRPAHTPAKEHAQGHTHSVPLLVFSAEIEGSVQTNHSHVFGEGWKECTFPRDTQIPPFASISGAENK